MGHSQFGLGSNISHGLFVGWVEHPDIFCWLSFFNPTYFPAVFMLLAKPNKMAEDRTIRSKFIKKPRLYEISIFHDYN
jgi:hypothetical protein